MLYIEDLLDRLANNGSYIFHDDIALAKSDSGIILSMSDQVMRGNYLTEKQRTLAIRFAKKYKDQLSAKLNIDVTPFIDNPQFKHPIRTLIDQKTITIQDDKIYVKFPFDKVLVERIKSYKNNLRRSLSTDISWSDTHKSWIFDLIEPNVLFLASWDKEGFQFDDQFTKLAQEVNDVAANVDHYLPMIVYENNQYMYKNVSTNIPANPYNNVIDTLIEAKKYGITCWDDAIEAELNSDKVNSSIRQVIKSSGQNTIELGSVNLDDLKDIFRHHDSILFVVPGGSELEHLRSVHEYLNSQNYKNTEMSVMFRLDSSFGKVCNEYIRSNQLNTPLNENIKFVFVSGKLQRPILEQKRKFDTIINFGTNSAHYTLRQFVKQHHNSINMNLIDKKD